MGTAADREAPPLLELRQVTKVYGEGDAAVHALRGVDLAIQKGEFVAILGTSGCGKSTAMNILGCLDTPTSGTFRLADEPMDEPPRLLQQALGRDIDRLVELAIGETHWAPGEVPYAKLTP